MSRIAALWVTCAFHSQVFHAAVLGFIQPVTGGTLRFEAPVPPNMAALIAALKQL